MNMPSLNGKTALVTGASRGMGRASALALAAAGAQVLVHYGRGAKEADGVVAEIRKAGGRADAIATDLATADGPGKLASRHAASSETAWTSLSPMPESRKLRPSRKSRSRISISSLRSMSARRIS
jgi:NAD(P)-dependent dehydrogenase (short-subunit alcohol dehydrogenase family)